MIGSVLPWNPETNSEIGDAATRNNASGAARNGDSRMIANIRIVLARSATAHTTRSQKRSGIRVRSESHPPRYKSRIVKGGWLNTSVW